VVWHGAGIAASAIMCGLCARIAAPWHLLIWVMLVPWLLALDRVPSWPRALCSGVVMAIAFSVAVFAWFPLAMADYAGAPVALTAAIALVAAPALQPAFAVFGVVRHVARAGGLGGAGVAIAGASAWVATEWLVPKLLGDTLGIGLYPSRLLRQAADLAGLGGLTFVVLLGNECVRSAVAAVRDRAPAVRAGAPLGGLAALVGGLALYGTLRLATLAAVPAPPPVRFGVVQANVAHYDRLAAEVGTFEAVRRILDAQLLVTDDVLARGPVDVLVWPETVYPTTFGTPKSEDGAAFDRLIAGLVARRATPLVFGSYDVEAGREFNAAVFLEPDGDGVRFEAYRKWALFPLTERVPAWLDGPRLRAWLPWLGSWEPGRGPAVLTLGLRDGRRLRVAPLICYDAVDPRIVARGVRAGAEVVVTLSNDSWLTAGAGARLHFVVSAFRSIETRRAQVRATPTGISAVVTPAGEVAAAAPIGERTGLVASVTPARGVLPLAVRWGDWLGPTALMVVLGLFAGASVR
jgi:apolipoprotein N-acyltransferase